MRKLFIISIFATLFSSCCQNCKGPNASSALNKDSLKTVLINVDKQWSDLSQKTGFYHSRLNFVSDNSIELMGDGTMPLIGRKDIEDYTKNNPDSSFHIEWKALRAEVAASGDLGYTFGGWTMRTKTKAGVDTTLYGNYITVWHKQADGSWKYAVDGGNSTPKPVTE